MKRTRLLHLFLLLISISIYGQKEHNKSLKKEKFISIKKIDIDSIEYRSFIVTKNDTLVLAKTPVEKVVYPKSIASDQIKIFKFDYSYIAFGHYYAKRKPSKKSKNSYLRQWKVPIKIYINKSFSKEQIIDIQNFIKNIINLDIPNLKIELVKNKNIANYFITPSNEDLGILDKTKIDQYSHFTVENEKRGNGNYFLTIDGIGNIYGCILKINLNTFKVKDDIIRKIKMLFFGSLGRFHHPIFRAKKSILNPRYINNDTISKFDINVLKTHYSTIYTHKLDFTTFVENEKK